MGAAMTIVCVIALGVIAVLSAGAESVRTASRMWLRQWAGRRQGIVAADFLQRPHGLLAAATIAAALVLAVVGGAIAWQAATAGQSPLAAATGFGVALVATILASRWIARRWPDRVLPFCVQVLHSAERIAAPILSVGQRITGVSPDTAATPGDRLRALLRTGELEGIAHTPDPEVITGVLNFSERTAQQVMTRAADVFAVPAGGGNDLQAIARRIADAGYTRVPVYQGTPHRMVGMYHAFDVLRSRSGAPLPLRPVLTARPDTPCHDLLLHMLTERRHLAVVTDASSQALGIVTLEDLLEELVGDIRDEHDDPATPGAAA